MKVLRENISNITFDDVVSFCKKKIVEATQVEYKRAFPKKGLAKHFAAFSNTRGGIIIVGVDEDDKTSTPVKWEGIKNEGKLIDRVHQFASNVDPIPDYEVSVTDEKNGKVFLLIRIFEGSKSPYYVQNGSNVWVRTGNISKQIDIAAPEELKKLFNKNLEANTLRDIYTNNAEKIYSAALKRADLQRKEEIAREKEDYLRRLSREGVQNPNLDDFKSHIVPHNLGSNVAMCTIQLQPYYPKKSFIGQLELKELLPEIENRGSWSSTFPSRNVETTPEGTLSFDWMRDNGAISCEQIFSHGLIFNSFDVLIPQDGVKQFYLSNIARKLYLSLAVARDYYRKVGYKGNVSGSIMLSDVRSLLVNVIVPQGWSGFPESTECLLDKYDLDLETDTSVLSSPEDLQKIFLETMNKLYIHLNLSPPRKDLMEAFLKQEGWLEK